jgi:hypothetical protein
MLLSETSLASILCSPNEDFERKNTIGRVRSTYFSRTLVLGLGDKY